MKEGKVEMVEDVGGRKMKCRKGEDVQDKVDVEKWR